MKCIIYVIKAESFGFVSLLNSTNRSLWKLILDKIRAIHSRINIFGTYYIGPYES